VWKACALRASLYLVLSEGLPLDRSYTMDEVVVTRLRQLLQDVDMETTTGLMHAV